MTRTESEPADRPRAAAPENPGARPLYRDEYRQIQRDGREI
ncbi:hypothetical protein ACFXGA_27360 [Actinosynnema sp. NPDC059335]